MQRCHNATIRRPLQKVERVRLRCGATGRSPPSTILILNGSAAISSKPVSCICSIQHLPSIVHHHLSSQPTLPTNCRIEHGILLGPHCWFLKCFSILGSQPASQPLPGMVAVSIKTAQTVQRVCYWFVYLALHLTSPCLHFTTY